MTDYLDHASGDNVLELDMGVTGVGVQSTTLHFSIGSGDNNRSTPIKWNSTALASDILNFANAVKPYTQAYISRVMSQIIVNTSPYDPSTLAVDDKVGYSIDIHFRDGNNVPGKKKIVVPFAKGDKEALKTALAPFLPKMYFCEDQSDVRIGKITAINIR